MSNCKCLKSVLALSLSALLTHPMYGADEKKPSEAEMMATMMKLAQPGPNHKQMQDLVGTWSYVLKVWTNPGEPPTESSGVTVTRSVMEGRYLVSDHSGKMQMPGADGKMTDMEFKGLGIEGYDNVKQKHVSTWIDNMGTGIMNLEGTYDPATKTLTYNTEFESLPGVKTKMREVIKTIDKDHYTIEFLVDREGKEFKTMQIDYARKS